MNVLQAAKAANPALVTKSSIMLGLGETDDEILQTLRDLRKHGVDVVTFGQYLQPTKRHLKVADYVTPEAFDRWRDAAQALGFLYVASGPLVRSSYRAGELFVKNVLRGRKPKKVDVAEPLAAVVASTGATTAATAAMATAAAMSQLGRRRGSCCLLCFFLLPIFAVRRVDGVLHCCQSSGRLSASS